MNIAEKVIDIVKGMEGVGGIPTDEEFLNEFEFRLQALKQGQELPIDNVISESGKKQTISELEEVTVRGIEAYTEQDTERTAVCEHKLVVSILDSLMERVYPAERQ